MMVHDGHTHQWLVVLVSHAVPSAVPGHGATGAMIARPTLRRRLCGALLLLTTGLLGLFLGRGGSVADVEQVLVATEHSLLKAERQVQAGGISHVLIETPPETSLSPPCDNRSESPGATAAATSKMGSSDTGVVETKEVAARYAESLVRKDREIMKLQGELDLMKQHAGEHADTKVAASARGEPTVMKSNAVRTEAAAAAVVEAASAEPPPSPPAAAPSAPPPSKPPLPPPLLSSSSWPPLPTEGIPLIVHFTGPERNDKIWGPRGTNSRHTPPGTEFRFYDDDQMELSTLSIASRFEKVTGVTGVYEAWKMLRPIAFRADLWRLLVLWEHGGIYMDSDLVFLSQLSKFVNVDQDTVVICIDPYFKRDDNAPMLWNALMAARRGSPELTALVKVIVRRVQKRSYGENVLDVTGPSVVGDVLAHLKDRLGLSKVRTNCEYRHDQEFDTAFDSVSSMGYKIIGGYAFNGVVVSTDPNIPELQRAIAGNEVYANGRLHGDSTRPQSVRDYGAAYANKMVFCDDPGPPCKCTYSDCEVRTTTAPASVA
jgi:hypothetical protein